jgi:hypothetical protein
LTYLYLSYYLKRKLPNSSFLISFVLFLILSSSWHSLKQRTLLLPCVTTICTDNCSSTSYHCVQYSIPSVWKHYLTLLANICNSALGLYITVNNTSGHLEQFVDALMVKMQLACNL